MGPIHPVWGHVLVSSVLSTELGIRFAIPSELALVKAASYTIPLYFFKRMFLKMAST